MATLSPVEMRRIASEINSGDGIDLDDQILLLKETLRARAQASNPLNILPALHVHLEQMLEVDDRDTGDAHLLRHADLQLANAVRFWLEAYGELDK